MEMRNGQPLTTDYDYHLATITLALNSKTKNWTDILPLHINR